MGAAGAVAAAASNGRSTAPAYFVHDLPRSAAGKRRQATQGGFATEREAFEALTRAVAAINAGGYLEATRITVGEYLDQWVAGKARLRSNTRRSYLSHIRLYLEPALGHLRLVELRDVHIERLYAVLPLVGRPPDGLDVPDELVRILAARRSKTPARPMGPASIRRVTPP